MASQTVVGDIGTWAASCIGRNGTPSAAAAAENATAGAIPPAAPHLSFNNSHFADGEESVLQWREKARATFIDSLMMPNLRSIREAAVASVETGREYELDNVTITELSWQLPYGVSRTDGDRNTHTHTPARTHARTHARARTHTHTLTFVRAQRTREQDLRTGTSLC